MQTFWQCWKRISSKTNRFSFFFNTDMKSCSCLNTFRGLAFKATNVTKSSIILIIILSAKACMPTVFILSWSFTAVGSQTNINSLHAICRLYINENDFQINVLCSSGYTLFWVSQSFVLLICIVYSYFVLINLSNSQIGMWRSRSGAIHHPYDQQWASASWLQQKHSPQLWQQTGANERLPDDHRHQLNLGNVNGI